MNLFRRNSPRNDGPASFDMLRAGLEAEIARPAVVAITASTKADGSEVAARGLAESLAATGYSTLFVDATPSSTGRLSHQPAESLEELANGALPEAPVGSMAQLDLIDVSLQKTTSQKDLHSTLGALRCRFDYVVIHVEDGPLSSFATSLVTSADAVLVTVKTGRRQKRIDVKLASALNRLGAKFLGVLAIDEALIHNEPRFAASSSDRTYRRTQSAHIEKDFARREMAEWPT